MKNKKLYIIGNGFDIHHGIKSRYTDFKDYVKGIDDKLYNALEEYFNVEELWADFEEALSYIDTDKITEDASDYLVDYSSDNWSDANHHDYQYEIQRAIDIVTIQLKNHFTNWILQLEISGTPNVTLDKDSKFLVFNYTNTLEHIYHIDSNNIIYIHNKAIDKKSLLILGHSREPSEKDTFNKYNDEDTDVRIADGNNILDKYFRETYKNTNTIIQENEIFFSELGEMDEIFILGHSLSSVDIKYFELIYENVKEDAIWTVTYYGDEQKDDNKKLVIDLGVDESRIVMVTLKEI